MTVIVAFGDSNTWGYEPGAGDGLRRKRAGPASCSASSVLHGG